MKSRSLFAAGLCLLTLSAMGQGKLDARRTLGKPHTFRNLTLLPVSDTAARSTNAYVTLDEALRARSVQIKEAQGGGDVNTLYVINRGKKPLYLMGGEVVLGGQQDRVVAQDRIIAPGTKKVPITVFCVEHGRWSGRGEFDASAATVASASIRLNAQEGDFAANRAVAMERVAAASPRSTNTPAMMGSAAVRAGSEVTLRTRSAGRIAQVPADAARAVSSRVGGAQQQVWAKVAEKNANLGTQSDSGTYRRALNMAGGKAKSSVPAYVQALSGSIGNDPHIVGVVACVNGKVVAIDTFGDPALFRKLWPKLLRSYAADAVESASNASRKMQVLAAKDVQAFYAAATDAKTKQENRTATGTNLRMESKQATAYRLHASPKPMAAGGAASPIHEGVLSK